MKRVVKMSVAVSGLAILCLILTACPITTQVCANGVNKYANALSSFQDAEIKLHQTLVSDKSVPPKQVPLISDLTHINILHSEKAASKAGRDLDAAIALADAGADPSEYVKLAQSSFDDLIMQLGPVIDGPTHDKLILAAQVAGDALKNAISLIEALRASKPAAVVAPAVLTPHRAPDPAVPVVTNLSTRNSHGLPLWVLGLPLIGLAAGAGALAGLDATVKLLGIIVTLEPVAFDLIVKFATSLKGKSTAEILAMNEQIFGKVDATADAELGKMGTT